MENWSASALSVTGVDAAILWQTMGIGILAVIVVIPSLKRLRNNPEVFLIQLYAIFLNHTSM